MRRIHDCGTPRHRRQREAAAQSLRQSDEIGYYARMVNREHLAGARNAALHFVRDQHDAVLIAESAQGPQEVERRNIETALALHGLDDDGGNRFGIDIRVKQPVYVGKCLFSCNTMIRLWKFGMIDLGWKRSEAAL